ncbi:hypothetical protein COF41_29890 [Bacillus toyonensis]|uniref:hypothetical protein n=1 Tax=Bacillus toyonensis TaxID=155322 RepID=UPI000BFC3FE8|nr:hypothetical protein [Bacillus toyonensis]MED2615411.1 hypothetical protein [Bacillus toyonensis]PHE10080.1 hypothetical protein COF41_29890 [Bacillus toyonensis]
MILRHLTTRDKIFSIVEERILRGSDNLRKAHKGFVSFELFNPNVDRDAFKRIYLQVKPGNFDFEDIVELLFDGNRMVENGIEIVDCFTEGRKDTKSELSIVPGINQADLEVMGDYQFVYGDVSLDYLTDESKRYVLENYNIEL